MGSKEKGGKKRKAGGRTFKEMKWEEEKERKWKGRKKRERKERNGGGRKRK